MNMSCTNSNTDFDFPQYTEVTYRTVRCQSKILEKIVYMDSSSNSLIVTVLKCRKNRGVTGFRPPPKG